MYRIPKIEEFVEGLKFEVYLKRGGHSWCMLDTSKCPDETLEEQLAVNRGKTIEDWEEFIVPSLDKMGIEWHFPFSIVYFLKEKKIRIKI